MLQYLNLPVYILYSKHSQESTWTLEDAINYQTLYRANIPGYKRIISTAKQTNELLDDKSHFWHLHEAKKYESFIKSQLDIIRRTHIGQMLLAQFNTSIKTYIIPDPNILSKPLTKDLNGKKYYDFAVTLKEKDQRGVETARIHINADGEKVWFDELLFHELVHAARYANRINVPREIPTHPYDFVSSEEFIAAQMTNIYRSSVGKKRLFLYYVHEAGQCFPKEFIYSSFADTLPLMGVIKHFLNYDNFTKQVARFVTADYNPFRDYPILLKETIAAFSDKVQIPNF